jgi:hypothetical protein
MKYIVAFGLVVGLVIGLSFLLSWPVMALWNGCLVDAVTVTKPITWLQAWGISLLFGLLVKSTSASATTKN